MTETRHFINAGYGWTCQRCREAESARPAETDADDNAATAAALPRFFREGEAEEREMSLSFPLLARWKDDARQTLVCPRCGVEESV